MPMDTVRDDFKPIVRLCTTEDGMALRWETGRRPALTPAQAAAALVLVASTSGIAAALAWGFAEAAWAWAFLSVAGLSVGAFLHYAHHACDGEVILLIGAKLEVKRRCGHRSTATSFDVDWVRIECGEEGYGLVRVSQRQAVITVGRHLTPERRGVMVQEISRALGYCRTRVRW